ncbi:sugar ABC transporter permease [Fodinicurvata sp. EGI_FJ10296]|uniref:carbohydrate ABC transporter permease n=1 Tax=Fodinicurvata sp. EGI_FJ10296 TaxID=3231908 RepID=UPI0034530F4D
MSGTSRSLTTARWTSVAMMAGPGAALITLFVIVPFFLALVLTFTDQRLISPNPTSFVGLQNYERLLGLSVIAVDPDTTETGATVTDEQGQAVFPALRGILRADPDLRRYRPMIEVEVFERKYVLLSQDPMFWQSLFNTFLFAFLVVPLQCGSALALALLVNRMIPGRTFFRLVYFMPVVTSMVVVSIIWTFLLDPNHGMINGFVGFLSLGTLGPFNFLGSEALVIPAIAVMSAWQGAGFQMLIFLAGLQGINRDLYDAASVDGATPWQKFRHVTLPGLRNTTVFVVISTTILAFGLFTQIDVMTGGGPSGASSTVVYHAVRTGFREQNIAYGSTITLVYFLLVLGVALIQRRLIDKGGE